MAGKRNRLLTVAAAIFVVGLAAGWVIAPLEGTGTTDDAPEISAVELPSPIAVERGAFRPASDVPDLYRPEPAPVVATAESSTSTGTVVSSGSSGYVSPSTGSAPAPAPAPPSGGSSGGSGGSPITVSPGGGDVSLP